MSEKLTKEDVRLIKEALFHNKDYYDEEFFDSLISQITNETGEILLFTDECEAIIASLMKFSYDFFIDLCDKRKDQIDEIIFKMDKIIQGVD